MQINILQIVSHHYTCFVFSEIIIRVILINEDSFQRNDFLIDDWFVHYFSRVSTVNNVKFKLCCFSESFFVVVKYHYTKDFISQEKIKLQYWFTAKINADDLIKSLRSVQFKRFINQLRMTIKEKSMWRDNKRRLKIKKRVN